MNGSGANIAGCAACKGRCCRQYRVPVTVTDVWTLVAGTGIHPRDFIDLYELPADRFGFRLRRDGAPHELCLTRNRATGACVFLMEIAPGVARCGVYSHRPLVCANFPTMLREGAVAVRGDVSCGTDAWNLATMDLPAYRRGLVAASAANAAQRDLVAAWNTAVDERGGDLSAEDLFDFLLSRVPSATGDTDRQPDRQPDRLTT